ncbi:SAM-dependent methyltransferase [Kitasatospora sp. MAP12-15]|uniref:class I SAM-dependent methyltransferase n=1 Tax=unclassified Kitasatospora TaxID=2633591 RepID=UPI0024755482|nr:class I SAM-dependent methyltransferase [Kitasatospora sp. MAP12-44]MDH6109431.1 SAM-dependent methyltransferase [Kitasatospora sp. MAP12-44]
MTDDQAARGQAVRRPSGVREVFAYNWPSYLAGGLAVTTSWALGRRLPRRPAALARAGALTATGWLVSSTAASWWVYDRSELHSFGWLADLLPHGPGDHLVVSSGLDEASRPLAARYPGAAQSRADLYDPALTTEGSIRRARRRVPPIAGTRPARPERLPAPASSQDTVFLVFAAHELRQPADREALFAECARTLRPGGTLILVEHLRDAANTAVYGPGAWHFLPRAEWLRLAGHARLRATGERRIAAFVTAFAFSKAPQR